MTTDVILREGIFFPANTALAAGATVTLPDDLADTLVAQNKARYVVAPVVTPRDFTAAERGGLQALVSEAGIQTWANRGVALAAGLTRCFFTDIGPGGSYWDYIGGRWRPQARRVMLANLTNDVTSTGTVFAVMHSVLIPAGLMQDGDILEWFTSHTKTGGTAETATIDWRIGASPTAVGLALFLQSTALATTQVQHHSQHRLRRINATTGRNLSAPGSTGLGNSSAAAANRTIPSMDADTYWQVIGNMSVGAETLTITGASLYLESGA